MDDVELTEVLISILISQVHLNLDLFHDGHDLPDSIS